MEMSSNLVNPGRSHTDMLTEIFRFSRYELFRMRRRPAFIVLSSLAVLFFVIPALVAALLAGSSTLGDFSSGELGALDTALGFSISPLFYLIAVCIGALVFGADFGPGTYRTLHARGASRISIPISKVAFIFLTLAGLLVSGWVVSLIVVHVVTLIQSSNPYSCNDCVSSIGQLARALPGIAFWSLAGSCLTFWGRSTTLGVGVGLGYYFASGIFKPILSFGFHLLWDIDIEPVLHWLPGSLAGAFLDADSTHITYWASGLGAVAYCVLLVLFISWLSKVRDVTPPR